MMRDPRFLWPGPEPMSLIDASRFGVQVDRYDPAHVMVELRICMRWLDELGVHLPRHREATIWTLADLDLFGRGVLRRDHVEHLVATWGYPTRWHRFCRRFRAFWLEPRWEVRLP